MNGGLTALLLVETARPHLPRPIAAYAARAISPLFVGQRVAFNGRLAGDAAALWAAGPDGGLAYRVDVTLAGAPAPPPPPPHDGGGQLTGSPAHRRQGRRGQIAHTAAVRVR